MKFSLNGILLLLLIVFLSCKSEQKKLHYEKRFLIAVGDLQNRSNDSSYDALMYTSTGNFIYELNRAGVFRIIERERLGSLLDEYNLARTGLVGNTEGKELGRILGVDAVLLISLSSVEYKLREQNFNTKNLNLKPRSPIPSNLYAISANEELNVILDARLISVGNGEVLAAAKYRGNVENFYSAIIGITKNGSMMDKREAVKKILNDSAPILARDIALQTEENFHYGDD